MTQMLSRVKQLGLMAFASLLIANYVTAEDFDYFKEFDYETFTSDDFEKFYGLIEDGKITRDKLNSMCEKRPLGFTVEARDVVPETSTERLFYNVSKRIGSVDGRAFRARYFNASLGEWTGAVFKPICPGLYSFSLDFTARVSGESAKDISINLLLRRSGWDRPGKKVATAIKTSSSPRGSGYTSVVMVLGIGDEIATVSEIPGSGGNTRFEVVRLSVYKIDHLEALVTDLDVDVRQRELEALDAGTPAGRGTSVDD